MNRRTPNSTVTRSALAACLLAISTVDGSAQQPDSLDTPRLRNADDLIDELTDNYPTALREKAIGGTTHLRLKVDGEGRVRETWLASSSGLFGFDAAAFGTAREARFEVPRATGDSAEYWTDLPFTFRTGYEKDPEAQRIPLLNRDEVERDAQGMKVRSLVQAKLGAGAGFAVFVDSAGRPARMDVVESSCFTEADLRAAEIVRRMTFEAAATSALRRTYVSVHFGQDTVTFRLTGDARLPSPSDTAADTTRIVHTGKPRLPVIGNRREVARALERYYPSDLKDSGIGGEALMRFELDEEGNVLFRTVVRSSGICRLDAAAILATEQIRFTPAIGPDGKPIPMYVQLPLSFSSK